MKRSYIVGLLFSWIFVGPMNTATAQEFVSSRTLSRAEMTNDFRVAMRALEKHHPHLYKYVGRAWFQASTDTLLQGLPDRMGEEDFYLVLSRQLYKLRHGHMLLFPEDPDQEIYRCNILYKLNYEIYHGSLYIVSSESDELVVNAGTRLVAVNGMDVSTLLSRYSDAVPVEGYGETLRKRLMTKMFPLFLAFQIGAVDSLRLEMEYLDSGFVQMVRRCDPSASNSFISLLEVIREQTNPSYRRDSTGIFTPKAELRFPGNDYQIALLTVRSFMQTNRMFYSESFKMLDSLRTRHLVIDLRDNLGGLLSQAGDLYSYLTDTSFVFIERPITISRLGMFYPPGAHMIQKIFITLFLPVMMPVYAPIERAGDLGFSFNAPESRPRSAAPKRFQGSVSILVNGGTYSAASLLAANLKYHQGVLVVGEETGGATEGTVAMKLGVVKLPNSGFYLRYGVGYLQPSGKGGVEGRGVMPDIPVLPELHDRINGNDPQLQLLLDLLQR
jgi:hypothetical protein